VFKRVLYRCKNKAKIVSNSKKMEKKRLKQKDGERKYLEMLSIISKSNIFAEIFKQ